MVDILEEEILGVRELSQYLQITEKEVYNHLEQIERGLKASGKKLQVEPARCLSCGFVFEDRTRKKSTRKMSGLSEDKDRSASFYDCGRLMTMLPELSPAKDMLWS